MDQILTVRVLTGHQMVIALNDYTVVRYFLERNDVTFSRPDSRRTDRIAIAIPCVALHVVAW